MSDYPGSQGACSARDADRMSIAQSMGGEPDVKILVVDEDRDSWSMSWLRRPAAGPGPIRNKADE